MSKFIANPNVSVPARPRAGKLDLRLVAVVALLVLGGGVASLYPEYLFAIVGAVVAIGLTWLGYVRLRRMNMEIWQLCVLVAVSGYLLLNYGFENLAVHIGGFPVIISYGLMYTALALALWGNPQIVKRAAREPAVFWVLVLLGMAVLHLLVNIPTDGVWALRDATMCLDGMFMLLGVLWAMKANSATFFAKWLMVIFTLNMFYSYTLPWAEKIWGWSPESGVFLSVPLFGNFNGAGDLLLAGALFCIFLGSFVIKRPNWLITLLTLGQLIGLAITQVRRMYLAVVVVILILALLGEIKKFTKLLIFVPIGILVVFLVTSVGGLEINGRIGPINLSFFKDHIRSISGAEDAPGSPVETRFSMGGEAFQHFLAHPIFGEGFGQPLLTVIDRRNGAVTRMPHNSSITYLARLGFVGFIAWMAFHFSLAKRFISVLRRRSSCPDQMVNGFVLWFFLFYVLFMIGSLVEGPFEFPSGAVPFYFFMGFALGLMRKHFPDKKRSEQRLTTFAGRAEKAYL